MVKLIALDMDGTLMWTDHLTVTEENRKALRFAHDNGAKIAIATGRTVSIIGDVCSQVPEIDYIIYSNGAGVFDRRANKSIYENLMSWDFCKDMLEYLNALPAFLEIYVDGVDYVQADKAQFFKDDLLPQEFVDKLMEQMTVVDNLLDTVRGKDIEKVTVYIIDKELRQQVWDRLKKNDEIYLASSLPISMEFTLANVNKGTAMDGMCRVLGITSDNCMAFGDAGNDCEMLEFSKYSFAMANGTDECKASAKYETKSNANDGVAYGIYQIMK